MEIERIQRAHQHGFNGFPLKKVYGSARELSIPQGIWNRCSTAFRRIPHILVGAQFGVVDEMFNDAEQLVCARARNEDTLVNVDQVEDEEIFFFHKEDVRACVRL